MALREMGLIEEKEERCWKMKTHTSRQLKERIYKEDKPKKCYRGTQVNWNLKKWNAYSALSMPRASYIGFRSQLCWNIAIKCDYEYCENCWGLHIRGYAEQVQHIIFFILYFLYIYQRRLVQLNCWAWEVWFTMGAQSWSFTVDPVWRDMCISYEHANQ